MVAMVVLYDRWKVIDLQHCSHWCGDAQLLEENFDIERSSLLV